MSVNETSRQYRDITPEKKEKWFGAERNARRRERYHSDPAYREAVLTRTKQSRAEQRAKYMCTNPVDVQSIAQTRTLMSLQDSVAMDICSVSKSQLVNALGISPMTFSRWLKSGMVLRPGLFAPSRYKTQDSRHAYYSVAEARLVLDAFINRAHSSTRLLRALVLSGYDLSAQMIISRNKDIKEALNV